MVKYLLSKPISSKTNYARPLETVKKLILILLIPAAFLSWWLWREYQFNLVSQLALQYGMTVQEFQSRARSTGSLPTSEEEVGKWIHQMRQNDKDDLYDLLTQRRSLDELIKLQETKLKEAGISYQSILEDMQTDTSSFENFLRRNGVVIRH